MVANNSEIPQFELSAEAQREAVIMEAVSVSPNERWRHLGEDDQELLRFILVRREELESQGASARDLSLDLVTSVNEYHRIKNNKLKVSSPNPEIAEAELSTDKSTEPTDNLPEKKYRHRSRILRHLSAAAIFAQLYKSTEPKDIA